MDNNGANKGPSGAVIGGVIGGVLGGVLLICIAATVIIFNRRKVRTRGQSLASPTFAAPTLLPPLRRYAPRMAFRHSRNDSADDLRLPGMPGAGENGWYVIDMEKEMEYQRKRESGI